MGMLPLEELLWSSDRARTLLTSAVTEPAGACASCYRAAERLRWRARPRDHRVLCSRCATLDKSSICRVDETVPHRPHRKFGASMQVQPTENLCNVVGGCA